MTEEFARTSCACKGCIACCKRQPGPLAPGDLERIADFLGAPVDDVKGLFWASPGALVKNGYGDTKRIGTITPRFDRRLKRCVFLDDKDHCKIHPVAPFGCSHFDVHMSWTEAHERSVWLAARQMDADYQKLRNTLPYAQHHKPAKY